MSSCCPFGYGDDANMHGLFGSFFSRVSDIDIKGVSEPFQKILNKEEVTKEEVKQTNQETRDGLHKVASKIADAAADASEIGMDDTPEEKKAKVTFYVKVHHPLNVSLVG